MIWKASSNGCILDNRLIFEFLNKDLGQGRESVLVTVISVAGSSMRNPGAHMAVSRDGDYVGSLSGGCIERAVVSEALDVLKAGGPRIVRFGKGSPYLDIKLPCGGGLDVHFMPLNEAEFTKTCIENIDKRIPFGFSLPIDKGEVEISRTGIKTGIQIQDNIIVVGHEPNPKVLIIGHGAATTSMARLSREMRFDAQVLTSDQPLAEKLYGEGFDTSFLKTPVETDRIVSDPWTAIVFLFHDHDWEGALMQHALNQSHFYFGAMGGRRAHEARRLELQSKGLSADKIETIYAPIGLFHSSRDPDSLALSALAQITQVFHNRPK